MHEWDVNGGAKGIEEHWLKKWGHFDLKSWVTGVTKIRHGIPSNWEIFESNWFDIENQYVKLIQIL